MLKTFLTIILLFISELIAQPTFNHLHRMDQKDSLYYLLTDKALLKFYSHEASGEFYLTKYVEVNFPSSTKFMLNDEYLFLSYNDSIFYYLNRNPWELNFENAFKPGFTITSLHGFGPYFFIRSGNTYHLFKIVNGLVVQVEDSLFNHPPQLLVFFTYPYVIIAGTVYKYIENFNFYAVGQVSGGNVNIGITGNVLVRYYFYVSYPGVYNSILYRTIIQEPDFPTYTYNGWGLNITQLHQTYQGLLIARKNLYFMTWVGVITTYNSQLAYLPTSQDRATITDYYVFLLGNDSLRYSKWNSGSTFYPFTWTDWTSVEENEQPVKSFELYQNYPNPFNPSTKIRYEIPERSFVSIRVYDVLGKEIATIVNEEKLYGDYEVEFNGNGLASGIYYYRITAGKFSQTRKMILLR
jgi:hypothetical protein